MSRFWRIDDDARYVREAADQWVYGAHDPHLAGLRVPGARDVTRGEVVPPEIEGRTRPTGYVFFRASLVARDPELDWLKTTGARSPEEHPLVGGYLGVPVAEWEPREGEVIGMRAPELGEGAERDVALAEREVRAWRRAKTRAARLRAALVAHARDELGAPGADVARWVGVSRNRVQQICEETSDASAPRPASLADAQAAVQAAHAAFVNADSMLHRAEALRRVRVAAACDAGGLSLGAVARILDVSRARAQQLRDAGRQDEAAA